MNQDSNNTQLDGVSQEIIEPLDNLYKLPWPNENYIKLGHHLGDILSPQALKLLNILLKYTNNETHACFPSMDAMQREYGMYKGKMADEQTIRNIRKELEDKEIVVCNTTLTKRGRRNHYYIYVYGNIKTAQLYLYCFDQIADDRFIQSHQPTYKAVKSFLINHLGEDFATPKKHGVGNPKKHGVGNPKKHGVNYNNSNQNNMNYNNNSISELSTQKVTNPSDHQNKSNSDDYYFDKSKDHEVTNDSPLCQSNLARQIEPDPTPPDKQDDDGFNALSGKLTQAQSRYVERAVDNEMKRGTRISAPKEIKSQVKWAVANAEYQLSYAEDFKHAVNICMKQIRNGQWKTPIGFNSRVDASNESEHPKEPPKQPEHGEYEMESDVISEHLSKPKQAKKQSKTPDMNEPTREMVDILERQRELTTNKASYADDEYVSRKTELERQMVSLMRNPQCDYNRALIIDWKKYRS